MGNWACNYLSKQGKMNGPGGATNATPGPDHRLTAGGSAHMADASQYRDSATAIKPIETVYRGYHFRSRLEARWAVFFDTAGIAWEYEPEGFEKDGDRYLPDFRLTLGGKIWWVEVKGDPNWLKENRQRINGWLTGAPIVPGGQLLLLGSLPEPTRGPLMVKALVCQDGAPCEGWAALEFWDSQGRVAVWPDAALRYFRDLEDLSGFQPFVVSSPLCLKGVKEALSAARQARFEHGESGAR